MERRSYSDSVEILKDRVGIIGDALPLVERVPRHDDEVLGPSIFRTVVDDASLEGLTLSGLYVGRSIVRRATFAGSELRLAAFNWSGIADCNFEGADLAGADLRACEFIRCSFCRANLAKVDLRCSTFSQCRFDEANLEGALLYRPPGLLAMVPRLVMVPRFGFQADPRLTSAQRDQVRWCRDAPVPGGG
jgi:pentapeptide repeat protein